MRGISQCQDFSKDPPAFHKRRRQWQSGRFGPQCRPRRLVQQGRAERPHYVGNGRGRFVNPAIARQLYHQRAHFRQDIGVNFCFLDDQIHPVEGANHPQRILQFGVGRIGERLLIDEHLQRARTHQRGDAHTNRA